MNEVINGEIEKPLETVEQCEANDSVDKEAETIIANGIDKLEINEEVELTKKSTSKKVKPCDVCLQMSKGLLCLKAVKTTLLLSYQQSSKVF